MRSAFLTWVASSQHWWIPIEPLSFTYFIILFFLGHSWRKRRPGCPAVQNWPFRSRLACQRPLWTPGTPRRPAEEESGKGRGMNTGWNAWRKVLTCCTLLQLKERDWEQGRRRFVSCCLFHVGGYSSAGGKRARTSPDSQLKRVCCKQSSAVHSQSVVIMTLLSGPWFLSCRSHPLFASWSQRRFVHFGLNFFSVVTCCLSSFPRCNSNGFKVFLFFFTFSTHVTSC